MKRFEKYYGWIIAFVFCVAVIAVYKTFDNFHNMLFILAYSTKVDLISAIMPSSITMSDCPSMPSGELTDLFAF